MRHESRKQRALFFFSLLGALPFWSTCVGEPFITVEPEATGGTAPAIKAQDGSSATSTSDGAFAGGASGRDPSTPTAICGDGTITGKEECDDANQIAGDGCDATCVIECLPGGKKSILTGNCYVAGPLNIQGNFSVVTQQCEQLGRGFVLPTLCTLEEIRFVQNQFFPLPVVFYAGAVQDADQRDPSTGWTWQDGNTCAIPWETQLSSEPNDGCVGCKDLPEKNLEQCTTFSPWLPNGLNDLTCSNSLSYICMRSGLSVSRH